MLQLRIGKFDLAADDAASAAASACFDQPFGSEGGKGLAKGYRGDAKFGCEYRFCRKPVAFRQDAHQDCRFYLVRDLVRAIETFRFTASEQQEQVQGATGDGYALHCNALPLLPEEPLIAIPITLNLYTFPGR